MMGLANIITGIVYRIPMPIEPPSFNLPVLTGFQLSEIWRTLMLAGLSQIPLAATNAVIATAF